MAAWVPSPSREPFRCILCSSAEPRFGPFFQPNRTLEVMVRDGRGSIQLTLYLCTMCVQAALRAPGSLLATLRNEDEVRTLIDEHRAEILGNAEHMLVEAGWQSPEQVEAAVAKAVARSHDNTAETMRDAVRDAVGSILTAVEVDGIVRKALAEATLQPPAPSQPKRQPVARGGRR